jgi:hypothetical protein
MENVPPTTAPSSTSSINNPPNAPLRRSSVPLPAASHKFVRGSSGHSSKQAELPVTFGNVNRNADTVTLPSSVHVSHIPGLDAYGWVERIFFLYTEAQLCDLTRRAVVHLRGNPLLMTVLPHFTVVFATLNADFPSQFNIRRSYLRLILLILLEAIAEPSPDGSPPVLVLRDRDRMIYKWAFVHVFKFAINGIVVNSSAWCQSSGMYILTAQHMELTISMHILNTFVDYDETVNRPEEQRIAAVNSQLDAINFMLQPELFNDPVAAERVASFGSKRSVIECMRTEDDMDEDALDRDKIEATPRKHVRLENSANATDVSNRNQQQPPLPSDKQPFHNTHSDDDEVFL